jgi:hypothetical protein
MHTIGDIIPLRVITQGAVRTNAACIVRAYEDCVLLAVDLHSKRAVLSMCCGACHDEDWPELWFAADENTLHLHESIPRNVETRVAIEAFRGWHIFGASEVGKYTMTLTLIKPDPEE